MTAAPATTAKTVAPTTANEVSLFKFKDADVRVVKIDGEPWFVATDVCRALDLDLAGGTGNHLRKLAAAEKRPVPKNLLHGKGANQVTLITESGLYKLVLRSDKPEAKKFQPLALRTG